MGASQSCPSCEVKLLTGFSTNSHLSPVKGHVRDTCPWPQGTEQSQRRGNPSAKCRSCCILGPGVGNPGSLSAQPPKLELISPTAEQGQCHLPVAL